MWGLLEWMKSDRGDCRGISTFGGGADRRPRGFMEEINDLSDQRLRTKCALYLI